MIQTQLLKLDSPYQIISARGYVGIQVGTLIVTKEVEHSSRTGRPLLSSIEFHSYPVVSYGLKQGLVEQLKYYNNPMDEGAEYDIRRRMQPEGAVWSGIEVRDVRVLGIAGAENRPVTLDYFVFLVPTAMGFDPSLHFWDKRSTSRIYELYNGLGNVGISTPSIPVGFLPTSKRNSIPVKLSLEFSPSSNIYFTKVLVIHNPYYRHEGIDEEYIHFRCLVDPTNPTSIIECATTISEALNGIKWFLPIHNLEFSWELNLNNSDVDYSDAMKQLTMVLEESYRTLR